MGDYDFLSGAAAWMDADPSNVGAKEKAENDARWVGDFTDELSIAIAMHDWNEAVSLVEKGDFSCMFRVGSF